MWIRQETRGFELEAHILSLILIVTHCTALGKSFHSPCLGFCIFQGNQNTNITFFTRLLEQLNRVKSITLLSL